MQGKLGHLTFNNAELIASLQKDIIQLDDINSEEDIDPWLQQELLQLVKKDLYRADKWEERIKTLTGGDDDLSSLDALIPPAYTGKTDIRLKNYCADLALGVRMAYPTQSIGRMIETDELKLGDTETHDKLKENGICTFLDEAANLGFELGRVPPDRFIAEHRDQLFADETPDDRVKMTTEGMKRLHRLYQVTPNDEALKVLYKAGIDSANDITAFPPDTFIQHYRAHAESSSTKEAETVFCKAQQVSAINLNCFVAAKQISNFPHVSAPSLEKLETSQQELIRHFPTLESLFGSLDFCECEHCNSVLSPAGPYLVDLFKFLDPDEEKVWKTKMKEWKENHGDAPYPFKDMDSFNNWEEEWKSKNGTEDAPNTEIRPYDVLINQRRPDLPHLPLTCENTHTALPYIDIVNEILEFWVANGKLSEEAVHDTGDASTAELLAEPQDIIPEAYDILRDDARYPLTLPFDLWLETVRSFLNHFDIPFWRVMEVFRTTEELFPYFPKKPSSIGQPLTPNVLKKTSNYRWSNIHAEYLGISPAEYAVITDSDDDLAIYDEWHTLYGYIDDLEARTEAKDKNGQRKDLNSAKTLSRRLGVSYKELIELLQTDFVNPLFNVQDILRDLKISAQDYFDYKNPSDDSILTESEKHAQKGERDAIGDLLERLEKKLIERGPLSDPQKRKSVESVIEDVDRVLVLADPDTGCNFDQTLLQYANGKPALLLDFLKINLFVRLWRKLGWTIEETDRALQVFLIDGVHNLNTKTLGKKLEVALVYIAHLKALDEKLKIGRNSRIKLLTLWGDLPTTGENSLYAQLFLTPDVLKVDSIFDHPMRQYLCYLNEEDGEKIYEPFQWEAGDEENIETGRVPLESHLPALQGALNLTLDDIGLILAHDAKADSNRIRADEALTSAALTLSNVSLLYRYGLMANALKLSVRELIALIELKELKPFEPPVDLSVHPEGYPLHALQLVETVEKINDSGFSIEDIDYLLCHRFDPVGKYRFNLDGLLMLVKTLAVEIRRIQTEHAIPEDLGTLTDDILRQKLSLILPADVAETFLGMLTGTISYEVYEALDTEDEKLDPEAFRDEPAISVEDEYDESLEELRQKLIYRGGTDRN